MFERLLIANRGEIAVRIIRSCRRMGITSIAVYSEADRGALHVSLADEAHCIGGAEAHDSYLDGAKIIALALRVGAAAVHPGYGFLSENAAFASDCEAAGLVFVGPAADSIERMGSKIEAKQVARDCGVPTVPGYSGYKQEPDVLRAEALDIGVPLLIKASAGGGGRGMRVVSDMAEFDALLQQSVSEARAAFGDGRVMLEKYVAQPRHLEVQVLGDRQGNVVHLFERECSIQRNHQKVIEEAPAAFLDSRLREDLYDHALRICRHIGYYSAGTVEFLLDNASGELYFLEMNTRLQVEHPVTELVTGVDLVEWQFRVAAGEPLTLAQEDLAINGWAMEARVTAEDPAENYRPETGELVFYGEPRAEGVRVDSGVVEGSAVSRYYDSLLGKIIGHGASRERASQRLQEALRLFLLGGVGNNIDFLLDLLARPAFLSTPLTTRFIEQQFTGGWQRTDDANEKLPVVAMHAWNALKRPAGCSKTPWQELQGWRLLRNAGHQPRQVLALRDDRGRTLRLEYVATPAGYAVTVDGTRMQSGEPGISPGEIEVEVGGELLRYRVKLDGPALLLARGARSHAYEILPQRQALARDAPAGLTGEGNILAPMPGVIESVGVSVGDRVDRGDVLATLEAMKLIHSLTSDIDGTVSAIHCDPGQVVEANALLLRVAADGNENIER
jgi:3-methylcrotonyl-CoA carboxylase alpha subunit